eukprot:scaffold86239_cov27-Tisochrysis_lutea.AAC.1
MRCLRIEAARGLEPDGGAPVAAQSRCPTRSPRVRTVAVEEILDELDVAAALAAASSRRAAAWVGHAGDNAASRALETSGAAAAAILAFAQAACVPCSVCRP